MFFIFYLFTNRFQLTSVPLFNACLSERPRVCGMDQGVHSVQEERQVVDKDETHYRCILRNGRFFLVNSLAFSGNMQEMAMMYILTYLLQCQLEQSLVL